MVRMFRTGAPVLVDVSLVQLLGLCAAWPLALRSAALKIDCPAQQKKTV
jgi:hypothetical protein